MEICVIGYKKNVSICPTKCSNLVFHNNDNTVQSSKPKALYDILEGLRPGGFYVECFGRQNNLRKNWITIGNDFCV